MKLSTKWLLALPTGLYVAANAQHPALIIAGLIMVTWAAAGFAWHLRARN